MILYVLTSILSVILIVLSLLVRHYSKFLGFTFLLIDISSIILIFMNFRSKEILINLICFAIMVALSALYAILLKKMPYDFTEKVISLRFIFNHFALGRLIKTTRVIGKVLPYNNYQLKYNGKYITSNEIVSAGATLISGSIGSGKTYGMLSLIKQDIMLGHSVIAAEYKGDLKVTKQIEDFANDNGYDVFKISEGKANFNYDPLQNINNVGRIEAIINMRKWSIDGADAHYRTSLQLLLQRLVGEYSHVHKDGSYTVGFYNYVKTYHYAKDEWDAYITTSKLLELLITSNLEPMFRYAYEKTLSFKELKNKKFVVIISFTSSNKELATSFTSLMFKDLLDELTIECPKKNLALYVDEFGTIENPFIIKDILEKGRSAKIATTLALQDINQIIIQTNEAYLNSILGIINTFIIYNGATRVTAEKFAGVQLLEIETVLMNLRKPFNGRKPTAIYISKYPVLNRKTNSEVFRFEPYIYKSTNTNSIKIEKENIRVRKESDDRANDEVFESNKNDERRVSLEKELEIKKVEISNENETKVDYRDFI